jgi:hypothetical protein
LISVEKEKRFRRKSALTGGLWAVPDGLSNRGMVWLVVCESTGEMVEAFGHGLSWDRRDDRWDLR